MKLYMKTSVINLFVKAIICNHLIITSAFITNLNYSDFTPIVASYSFHGSGAGGSGGVIMWRWSAVVGEPRLMVVVVATAKFAGWTHGGLHMGCRKWTYQ